jgi:dihydrofolate reductase
MGIVLRVGPSEAAVAYSARASQPNDVKPIEIHAVLHAGDRIVLQISRIDDDDCTSVINMRRFEIRFALPEIRIREAYSDLRWACVALDCPMRVKIDRAELVACRHRRRRSTGGYCEREREERSKRARAWHAASILLEGALQMGKIRFFFAASLDGFIADPQGGVDFLDAFDDEDRGYDAFFNEVGTLVMGRGTYKFVEDYGSWPYGDRYRTIVLTHRPIPEPLCELEARAIDDFSAFARELRALPNGDTWIVGGGKVMSEFLAAGEVDTIEMSIVPAAIGVGVPMYAGSQVISRHFDVQNVEQFPSGIVRITYARSSTSSG